MSEAMSTSLYTYTSLHQKYQTNPLKLIELKAIKAGEG